MNSGVARAGWLVSFVTVCLTVVGIRSARADAFDPADNLPGGATLLAPPVDNQVRNHGPHNLSSTDTDDWFKISLVEGETYQFHSMGGTGDCTGVLYSGPSTASPVAKNDNGGDNLQFHFTTTAPGTGFFYLKVSTATNPPGNCSYQLKYSKISPLANGTVLQKMGLGNCAGARFSPDGLHVLTLGGTSAILWDIESGQKIRVYSGHEREVTCAEFNKDGSRLMTGSLDGTMILWDTFTGSVIRRYSRQKALGLILDLAMSPDDTKVVCGTTGGEIVAINLSTGAVAWEITELYEETRGIL